MQENRQPLTDRQRAIYTYIRQYIKMRGHSPSIREIADAVGLHSTASTHAQLGALEKKGYIRREATKARAIEIVDEDVCSVSSESINVPIIRNVVTDGNIFADENVEGYLPFDPKLLPSYANTYIIHVRDEGMIKKGILKGDIVLVTEQSTANDGDMVVALVDGVDVVRNYRMEDGDVRLEPENDAV